MLQHFSDQAISIPLTFIAQKEKFKCVHSRSTKIGENSFWIFFYAYKCVYICIKISDENLFDQFVTFAIFFYHFTFAVNGTGDDDDADADADGERQFSLEMLYLY